MLGVDGLRSSVHEDVIFAFDISIKILMCILTYGCSVYLSRRRILAKKEDGNEFVNSQCGHCGL